MNFRAFYRNDQPAKGEGYVTDAFTSEAVAFVERHKAEPFFLYLPYNAVHQPQQATQKYLDRFEHVNNDKRRYLLAMLSAMDDGVGALLKKLDDEKLTENTLIFFISDNGGPTQGNGSRNTPLSGVKGQVLEGGIRIPYIIQWKSRIEPGRVIDQPVISLDIFPTACAAAGADLPSDRTLDGKNLLPLLKGDSTDVVHDKLYWRFGFQWAIREGDWKLEKQGRNDAAKLYNLKNDIGETTDLAPTESEKAKRLQADYDAWNKQLAKPLWAGKKRFMDPDDE
jgi:arylsulfatase A-like enzyme